MDKERVQGEWNEVECDGMRNGRKLKKDREVYE